MKKAKDLSRQTLAHRVKTWTKVLYDKKGVVYLVSEKHCMKKSDAVKKSGG